MSKEDFELSKQIYKNMESFYMKHGVLYDTQHFEKRKSIVQMFGDIATKDIRTFKIAMVIIGKLKGKANDMFSFFVRLHRALTVYETTYGEHEKYLKFFKKFGPEHFGIMLNRIKNGNEEQKNERVKNGEQKEDVHNTGVSKHAAKGASKKS